MVRFEFAIRDLEKVNSNIYTEEVRNMLVQLPEFLSHPTTDGKTNTILDDFVNKPKSETLAHFEREARRIGEELSTRRNDVEMADARFERARESSTAARKELESIEKELESIEKELADMLQRRDVSLKLVQAEEEELRASASEKDRANKAYDDTNNESNDLIESKQKTLFYTNTVKPYLLFFAALPIDAVKAVILVNSAADIDALGIADIERKFHLLDNGGFSHNRTFRSYWSTSKYAGKYGPTPIIHVSRVLVDGERYESVFELRGRLSDFLQIPYNVSLVLSPSSLLQQSDRKRRRVDSPPTPLQLLAGSPAEIPSTPAARRQTLTPGVPTTPAGIRTPSPAVRTPSRAEMEAFARSLSEDDRAFLYDVCTPRK